MPKRILRGNDLKAWRERVHITQGELARILNVSRRMLQSWENVPTWDATVLDVKAIAAALRASKQHHSRQWVKIMFGIANLCQRANRDFNTGRFYNDCGYIDAELFGLLDQKMEAWRRSLH